MSLISSALIIVGGWQLAHRIVLLQQYPLDSIPRSHGYTRGRGPGRDENAQWAGSWFIHLGIRIDCGWCRRAQLTARDSLAFSSLSLLYCPSKSRRPLLIVSTSGDCLTIVISSAVRGVLQTFLAVYIFGDVLSR